MRSGLAAAALTAVVVPLLLSTGRYGLTVPAAVLLIAAIALVFVRRFGGQVSAPLAVTAGVLLCVVVPLVFVVLTPSVPFGAWVLAVGIVVVSGLRLAWLIGDGRQRLVEAMVWTFVYVFLGLAPLVQLRSGIDPGTTPRINHSLDWVALSVVAVGTAAFGVGLVITRMTARPRRVVGAGQGVLPTRIKALTLFGLVCAAYFVAHVGVGALFGTRLGLNAAVSAEWPNSTTGAVVWGLAIMPLLVATVALRWQHAERVTSTPSRSWVTSRLLPACGALVLLIVTNPVGNARYTAGTVYLALLAAFGLVATRARFRAVCAGFVAGLLLLFPIADAYRSTTTASTHKGSPVAALTTGDYDAYPQIVNTVEYVQQHGLTHGYQALGPVVFWIPRAVWPQKPVDTGILLAESRGYQFKNLSAPLWAELYINGGWLVLIVGMCIFGMLVRRWDDRIIVSLRGSPMPGVLGCILPFYLLFLLRGSLLQATASLALIAVSSWFVRDRRREPVPYISGTPLALAPGTFKPVPPG